MKGLKISPFHIVLLLMPIVPLIVSLSGNEADTIGSIVLIVCFFVGYLLLNRFKFTRLKLLIFLNLAAAIPCIIIYGLFVYRKCLLQFVSMGLVVFLLVMILFDIEGFFKYGRKALIPLTIAVLGIGATFASGLIGGHVRRHVFQKRLPQYEEVVRMIENGDLEISDRRYSRLRLPKQYKHLAYCVIVIRHETGALELRFSWGSGYPMRHTDYVYCSDGKPPEIGWSKGYEVAEKWFIISY
ncbi:MAG: hypothetical protein OEW48_01905 [Phycisphaerae bacterium]|nr:hypothetical protein [Phycisphaerae bacterium]